MNDHLLIWEDKDGELHYEDDLDRVAALLSQHSWHKDIAFFPECLECQKEKKS